jgi:hypothetical protein
MLLIDRDRRTTYRGRGDLDFGSSSASAAFAAVALNSIGRKATPRLLPASSIAAPGNTPEIDHPLDTSSLLRSSSLHKKYAILMTRPWW